jgi:hypothetical protein
MVVGFMVLGLIFISGPGFAFGVKSRLIAFGFAPNERGYLTCPGQGFGRPSPFREGGAGNFSKKKGLSLFPFALVGADFDVLP